MKNLFASDSASKITLLDRYTAVAGIKLNPATSNCQTICFQCEKKLQSSHEFRELCQKSDKTLQERSSIKNESWASTELESFVYAEHHTLLQRTRAETDIFSHQVFVVNAAESSAIPMCDIKSEQISDEESEDKEQGKEVKKLNEGVVIKKEPLAVERNTTKTSPQNLVEGVASEEDDDNRDYDSYDDDVDVKNETKSSRVENPDILLLEGNFVCLVCEIVCDNLRDLRTHRKNHIWDIGRFSEHTIKSYIYT
jgi:hypothetical protein